uniref:Tubulin tyrosine ligase-like family, member 5 n=1 Tax=Sphaeramia orbicularis TaxID=375764 RepID=A0A673BJ25_9TELE
MYNLYLSTARKEKELKLFLMCVSVFSFPLFYLFLVAFLTVFFSSLLLLSSKVQARMAFSSYLQRVQQRLLAESRANTIPAWPDKDNDQMELVIRFLRRAASNLQQDIKVVLPSRQLPLQDRRRILSHQLGEFIHCYNKETEHMVKKQENSKEGHCVNHSVFQEYITAASENDLEEVLTYYTQKNKSATVFLGTKVRSVKKDVHKTNASQEPGNCEVSKSEFCLHFFLIFSHSHSILEFISKSQFCQIEALSDPPAYTSAPIITQPPRAVWPTASTGPNTVSTEQPTQVLRRIQSFTSSTPSSGAPSSIPGAMHIYSQKLSRPTSATVKMSSSTKLKSNSLGTIKELNSLSAQAQSNQQAFISALQKLADKQVARHYATSSHINLLTQHLSNLNLANRMLSREGFTLHPKVQHAAAPTQGPVKAIHSGSDLPNSTSHRPLKDEDALWDGQMQNAYSLVTGVSPQQRYQPTQGSYQLQFAIQQLQQQRLQSRQFLDQGQCRHQKGREVLRKKIGPPSFSAVALKEDLNRKSVFIHFPVDFGVNLWMERNRDRREPLDNLQSGMIGCTRFFPICPE